MTKGTVILHPASSVSFTTNGLGNLSDYTEGIVVEEINGMFELTLKYPIFGIHYNDITMRRILYAKPNPYSTPQPFRIYAISKPINGIVTINAAHLSYDLSGIPVTEFEATSATDALNKIKNNSLIANPFQFNSTVTTTGTVKVDAPRSARSVLGNNVLRAFGGEYEFDNLMVYHRPKRGINRGFSIRYGKNLLDINQEENIANVYTGVYPFWIGEDEEGTKVVVKLPEKIVKVEGTFDFERIFIYDVSEDYYEQPTETQMRDATLKKIKSEKIGIPTVSIDASFIQLSKSSDYKNFAMLEQVELGDELGVEFSKLGINAEARCVKTIYNIATDSYDNVELGDAKSNLATTISDNKQITEETIAKQQIKFDAEIGAIKIGIADIDKVIADKVDANWVSANFAHIVNGYIDNAQIKDLNAGTITTGDLQADVIKTNVIEAVNMRTDNATINAAKIGDLDADKIKTGDLDADRIKAGVIEAINISTDTATINSAKIGDLSADKIKTGTLHADRIGAGTITADKIAIGDFNNYITAKPNAEHVNENGVKEKCFYLKNETGYLLSEKLTTIDQGDKFLVKGTIYTYVKTGNPQMYFAWRNAEGAAISPVFVDIPDTVVGKYTPFKIEITVPTKPALAAHGTFNFRSSATGTGEISMHSPTALRKSNGELIVDGSITADKIEAGAITAGKIDAEAITADLIKSKVIEAINMRADTATINSAKIGDLNAEKITTGFLDAKRIKAGSIDADKINADTISAIGISAGKIVADDIAAGKIKVGDINIIDGTISFAKITKVKITNAMIDEAFIADAYIKNITADKIKSGTLDATDITVKNLNAESITVGKINGQQIAQGTISSDNLDELLNKRITSTESDITQALKDMGIMKGDITTAGDKANEAATKAEEAKSDADAAALLAGSANTNATTAIGTANTAKTTADTAKKSAETATSTANTAKSTADTAKSTADTAKSTADTAKTTASTAISTANTAKSTADSAKDKVDNLKFGGRNYAVYNTITGHENQKVDADYSTGVIKSDSFRWYMILDHTIVPNTEYVLSVDSIINNNTETAVQLKDKAIFTIYNFTTMQSITTIGTLGGGVNSVVFKTSNISYDNCKILIYVSYGQLVKFQINKLMLEKGNVRTDWQAAPEDIQEEIGSIIVSADGKNKVFYQTSPPPTTAGLVVNDTWFDTDDGNRIYRWSGTAWVTTQLGQNAIANAAIVNAHITDATITSAKIAALDAGKITTGTLSADRIGALSITAAKIAAGTITGDKITANTITGGNIAAGTIETTNLAAGLITTDKLGANVVTSTKINTEELFVGDNAFINKLKAVDIDASNITTGTIGGERIDITGLVSFNAFDPSLKPVFNVQGDKTYINGGMIAANTIMADKLDLLSGFTVQGANGKPVFNIARIGDTDRGTIEIDGLLKSSNFDERLGAGYQISTDGLAVLNEARISGEIILPNAGMTNYGGTLGNPNLLPNSDFSETQELTTLAKNPNCYPARWGAYNGGITNATTVYHAYVNTKDHVVNVVEFNESDGTRHWKAVTATSLERQLPQDATKYTFSLDANSTIPNARLFGGFHYTKVGGTTAAFHNGQFSIDEFKPNVWERLAVNVPIPVDADYNKGINFYVYGYNFPQNGILHIKKLKLEAGDQTPWCPREDDIPDSNPVRIWAGSDFQTRNTAPFRVYKNGDVFASNGTFSGLLRGTLDSGDVQIYNNAITVHNPGTETEVVNIAANRSKFDSDFIMGANNVSYSKGNKLLSLMDTTLDVASVSGRVIVNPDSSETGGLNILGPTGGQHIFRGSTTVAKAGTLFFDSQGASSSYGDFAFVRKNQREDVRVKVDGELNVKTKINTPQNGIELRFESDGWGFYAI